MRACRWSLTQDSLLSVQNSTTEFKLFCVVYDDLFLILDVIQSIRAHGYSQSLIYALSPAALFLFSGQQPVKNSGFR